ncbi:MAG: DHHA1 domain-containing protein [Acidobacteriota bacterium]
MTEKIYYHDSYAQTFSATVLESLSVGGRPAVVLDRTAFYPESGGQPWDVGVLGDCRVLEVVERDGRVLHFLDEAAPPPGSRIPGRIDWRRRFDFMQQHTGQHILSQACLRVLGAATLSSHLGETDCTIELECEISSDDERLREAERLANRVVFENRPVTVHFVDAEQARRRGVRKLPERDGEIRLIEVADFDVTACGGTHCRRTGEVGGILVTGVERIRRRSRLHFVCGERALEKAVAWRSVIGELTGLLSVPDRELPAALAQRLERLRDLQKELEEERGRRLRDGMAAAMRNAEPLAGGAELIVFAIDQADGKLLGKLVSQATADRPALICLAGSSGPGTPVVLARGPAAPAVDLREIFRVVSETAGGRGGGSPERVQGGGADPARLPEALEKAAAAVRRELDAGNA